MSDLYDLVKRYSIRNDRKIKRICEPLNECLDIQYFCYNYIESNGRFGSLCNVPEEAAIYFGEKLYLTHPYHRCPTLMRSGVVVVQTAYDEEYYNKIQHRFQVSQLFTIVEKKGNKIEFFSFAQKRKKIDIPNFCPDLTLLRRFIPYFKKEAKSIIDPMLHDGYNMKIAKGAAFTQEIPHFPISNSNPRSKKFLNKVWPLTRREEDLMDCLKEGMSSQATGAYLGLKRRTVEHYYDNIKAKLGCTSKSQLLEWCW